MPFSDSARGTLAGVYRQPKPRINGAFRARKCGRICGVFSSLAAVKRNSR